MQFKEERTAMAAIMQRMYDRGLATTSGGNLSMRVDEEKVLVSASQTDKGCMQPEDICLVTLRGENLETEKKPSMELPMHLAAYACRSDANAVVHAHPIFSSALMLSGKTVNVNLVGESRAVCGQPALANYQLMGTPALAEAVADALEASQVVLMQHHGVLTVGNTLLQAFDRMEVFEQAAKLTCLTQWLGGASSLPPEELEAIDALFHAKNKNG